VIKKVAFFLLIPIFLFLYLGFQKNEIVRKPINEEMGKTFLVVIDRISLTDLIKTNTPHIDSILEIGGLALMTTNTGGSRSQKDAYLTMGTGARVAASDRSPYGFQVDEIVLGTRAGDLYLQLTGNKPPEGAIVNLGFPQSVRMNNKRPYTVTIGALGAALEKAGIRCAVIGNCDIPGEYKRYLVSLMMNENGIVPAGCIDGSFLISDSRRPFGIRTDYDRLIQIVNQLWDSIDVFAIQLGDTSRAEDFRHFAVDEMNEYYKMTAVKESDAFVGKLLKRLNLKRDVIIIVTPLGPADDLAENNRLTPVIIAGKGYAKGLLSSASTQKAGIITNLDIGATILSFYNILPYSGQIGSKIYSTGTKMELNELLEYNKRLKDVHNQRASLLRSYVAVLIILLSASLLSIILLRKYTAQAGVFLYFIMSVPIAYLLMPLFHRPAYVFNLVLSWLLAASFTGFIYIWKQNTFKKISTICAIIVFLLFIDQLTGEKMISLSPLGYDIISGARFYGIGNEYMGIIIGAACIWEGSVRELWSMKKSYTSVWFIFPIFLLAVIMLAHPMLGANVGGTISLLSASASYILLNWQGKIKLRHMITVGIMTAVFITVLFLLDNSRPANIQTHMGQTVSLIRNNGVMELFLIIKRKIEMNIKLIRYTIWTRVFLLSLLSIALLMFRPVGILRTVSDKHPFFFKGIIAGIIGCITALIVNDSGIVAAGTSMIYTAPSAILVVIDYLPDKENKILWKVNDK